MDEIVINYDEAKVPHYELPDPLIFEDGSPVADANAWPARRAEILALFEQHIYGRVPVHGAAIAAGVTSVAEGVLGGLATRKEVTLRLTGNASHLEINSSSTFHKREPALCHSSWD